VYEQGIVHQQKRKGRKPGEEMGEEELGNNSSGKEEEVLSIVWPMYIPVPLWKWEPWCMHMHMWVLTHTSCLAALWGPM